MSTPGSSRLATGGAGEDAELRQLVSALPELYQPIHGHPEWSVGSSRACEDRWRTIADVYDRLAASYGRPLRVLDLGCAQGWFSLQCAARGASVRGFDRDPSNVAVCQALAARSPALDARFALGSIEEIIPQLGEDGFDLVLGLSVFHHLCNERGQEFVRDLLGLLLARVPNALFELALAAEPPAWARALPDDPAALLTRIPFARVLSRHPTHLSSLERPLYFCSRSHWLLSGLGRFERWARGPHRRVYAQGRSLAKVYEDLPAEALALEREAAYLESSSSGLPARPRLEESGHGDGMRWLRVEFPPGESVTEWIRQRRAYDEALLLRQLVRQLAAWEASELYDPGLRAAHLWVSADGLLVTDNGSLIAGREHLPASATPFLNFWITVHELCNRVEVPPESVDPRFYVHTGLPKPWSEWAKQFWARPQNEWSFRFLLETLP